MAVDKTPLDRLNESVRQHVDCPVRRDRRRTPPVGILVDVLGLHPCQRHLAKHRLQVPQGAVVFHLGARVLYRDQVKGIAVEEGADGLRAVDLAKPPGPLGIRFR